VVVSGEMFQQEALYPVIDTPFGRIGMIICFDVTFYEHSRILAGKGAQIIAASLGDWTGIGPARIVTSQFRAVENGVGYIKGELLAGSALIAPDGTVLSKSDPPGEAGESLYLVGDVPLGQGETLYTRIGDVFGWLCIAGLLVRMFFEIRFRRKAAG